MDQYSYEILSSQRFYFLVTIMAMVNPTYFVMEVRLHFVVVFLKILNSFYEKRVVHVIKVPI